MSNAMPSMLSRLRLQTLALTCKIGDAGAIQLCDALCQMGAASCMTTLILHKNEIADDGAEAVARLLRADVPLETIDVGINHFGARAASALAASMGVNRTLRQLWVHCNLRFTDADRATIVLGLVSNVTLDDLCIIEHRGPAAKVAATLVALLDVNKTVLKLHLSDSEFDDAAVVVLSAALSKSTCALRFLSLDINDLTDVAAVALVAALSANPHSELRELSVNETRIGDYGAAALVQAFGGMDDAYERKLSLRTNLVSEPCKQALASAWSARPAAATSQKEL
jgi:Ran GTPase-activating protein (RanGAP) involved in mRNA processing and transport